MVVTGNSPSAITFMTPTKINKGIVRKITLTDWYADAYELSPL